MPVRDFRRRASPVALCRAHRRNRAQPHQSGRCAARNGIHQLGETDLDLLRTLRGVYLRRSLVSVEESGCDARTKRMTKETLMSPEFDKRIPAALLILRFFLGTFLLQWSVEKLILPDAAARIASNFYGVTLVAPASYALGVGELILSLALLFGFYRTISYGLSLLVHTVTVVVSWRQLFDPWGLAKVGSHLWLSTWPTWGGFAALFLMREWDIWTLDDCRLSRSLPTDPAMRLSHRRYGPYVHRRPRTAADSARAPTR